MRLMVAVPTVDYVPADFVKSLSQLCLRLGRERIPADVQIIGGTLVYIARNRLAHRAIMNEYTHVLWLDSDMTFSDSIVEDLLFCGKDMVCGAFVSRRPPYGPCVYTDISDPGNMKKVEDFGAEPFRVDGCGFAAVLTSVDLLKAVWNKFDTCFRPTEKYGEDLAFCDRVKQIGREIWCEPTVRPGHIAHVPVYAGEHLFGGAEG